MRLTRFVFFLIASFVSLALPVFGQETVTEIMEILKKRDNLLFDQPEFSLSFRMVEKKVFLSGSIASGTIEQEIKVNKVGRDWAIARVFFDLDSISSNKPHYVIIKDKVQFNWASALTTATANRLNDDWTAPLMLTYLRFAGFTPSRAIAEDGGAKWEKWKPQTVKYFLVAPLFALLSEESSTFSIERNDDQNVVLKNKTEQIELDPQKGFLVVYRKSLNEDGTPRREIVASGDFRELIPGVWLPERIDVKQFSTKDEDEPSEFWGKLAAIDHWELGEFSLVADKTAFDVDVPPGVFVSDGIQGMVYRTTLDADPLDPSISESQIVKDSRFGGMPSWMLGGIAFVLGVVILFIWKRWQKA